MMLLEKLFGFRMGASSHGLQHGKRKVSVQLLFLFTVTLLFVLNYHFQGMIEPQAIHPRQESTIKDGLNALRSKRDDLLQLVNSTSNRILFHNLQFGESSFYDTSSDVVGTVEYSPYNRYQRQPYVSNGYIGARIPSLGQGFTYDQVEDENAPGADRVSNGWPLFNKRFSGAFVSGFYDIQENTTQTNFPELIDNGYESILSAIPQWTTLTLLVETESQTYTLDPSLSPESQGNVSLYSQQLSLADGVVTTEFLWLDTLHVTFTVLAHRSISKLGVVDVKIENVGCKSMKVVVKDEIDFNSSQRCQMENLGYDNDGIYMIIHPQGLDYVNGAIYSTLRGVESISKNKTESCVSQVSEFNVEPTENRQITKFAGIATSDLNIPLNPDFDIFEEAHEVVSNCDSFSDLLKSHKDAWHTMLGSTKITFPEDVILTMTSRASLYHMAANSRHDSQGLTAGLPVSGLSSDSYGGMVFWDTDLWMMNGMLPFIPDHARSLIRYRLHLREQARTNVPSGYGGAVYPWTSGRFGNCTSTGPCFDYEYHINTAIAHSAWQLYLSGAEDEDFLHDVALPIVNDAATFFKDYVVEFNETTSKYITHNLTDPDEYANHVDNGAYTNAGISLLMNIASTIFSHFDETAAPEFEDIERNIYLPSTGNEDNITLEYSGMNSSVEVKQADVIMISYPLNNSLISEDQAINNMQFYAKKQVNFGPAMTFPIFSIVSSQLSRSGCSSQSYLQRSIQPFLRPPFAQFSEQNNDDFKTNGGTHPAFPFLTAHGGFLQATLQGLIGLRYDFEMIDGKISRFLTVDPVAVPSLKGGVTFEGIQYRNESLDIVMDKETMTIKMSNISQSLESSITINVGERNAKAGRYELTNSNSLEIPLFFPNQTFEGSLVECGGANVYSVTPSVDGDVVELLNDGDPFTNWQAKSANETAKVLIDLKSNKKIKGGVVGWSDRPPTHWKLSAVNFTQENISWNDFLLQSEFGKNLGDEAFALKTIVDEEVAISAPATFHNALDVRIERETNTTAFKVDDSVESRFFLLEIEGIHDSDYTEGGSKIDAFDIY